MCILLSAIYFQFYMEYITFFYVILCSYAGKSKVTGTVLLSAHGLCDRILAKDVNGRLRQWKPMVYSDKNDPKFRYQILVYTNWK